MKKKMYVYCVDPIDDFHLWMMPSDIFNNTGKDDFRSFDEFEDFFTIAKIGAKNIGWEGDIREGPFVSILPPSGGGSQSSFIIAWKQDNNGTSFVASPHVMPWLDVWEGSMLYCDIEKSSGSMKITMGLVI